MVLLAIIYSPFAFVITAILIAFNMIFLPVALLKVILMKFLRMFKLKTKETVREFFWFFIFGFPLLCMSQYTDVYWFVKHTYSWSLNTRDPVKNF